jgi:hypothetical protein
VQYTGERFAYRLQATGGADADDDQDIRPDGSYVGAVLGNWILSAGYIDRWWGPGWEGSLILGTNARPMPAITLERNYSDAPDVPWLAWLGQFRSVITMAQFEHGRDDAPDAQLFGMRFTWKPHPRLEIGLSRSARWCGDGRPAMRRRSGTCSRATTTTRIPANSRATRWPAWIFDGLCRECR